MTWSLGVMIGGPQLASAAGTYTLNATAGIDYNSNIFDVPAGTQLQNGLANGGDTVQTYVLAGGATYATGPESLNLTVIGTHYEYERLTYLSHNELAASGLLLWHPDPLLDLQLNYNYGRAMAPFAQTLTQTLAMDTTKTATVTIGVKLTPVWRLDLAPTDRESLTPELGLPGGLNFPNFQLDEKGGSATLNYLGVTHVTMGISGSYLEGAYSDVPDATRYHQFGIQLEGKYKINDLSNFSGNIGYSRRNTVDNPAGSVGTLSGEDAAIVGYFVGQLGVTGGLTGSASYSHTLSPKTQVDFNAFRAIGTYVAGTNSLISTGLGGDIHWMPDVKLDATLSAQFEEDKYSGNGGFGYATADRADHIYQAGLQVRWAALSWLDVTARTHYNLRDSNFSLAGYSAWDVGINLVAKWQH